MVSSLTDLNKCRNGDFVLSSIPELSAQELQRLLSSANSPVIVACFTESCVPCKRMMPMLEDLRRMFSTELRIVQVDVERYPVIATMHDVAAVPTLLITVNGVVKERIVGIVVWKDLVEKTFEYASLKLDATHDVPGGICENDKVC
jgi:thioredoxin 1